MDVYLYDLRRKFYCAFWYKEAINDRYELICKIFQSLLGSKIRNISDLCLAVRYILFSSLNKIKHEMQSPSSFSFKKTGMQISSVLIIIFVFALAIKKYTQHEINLIFRKVRTFWLPRIIQWILTVIRNAALQFPEQGNFNFISFNNQWTPYLLHHLNPNTAAFSSFH